MQNSLPVFALLFNAFVWGVSWWPFRHLHAAGLHPLWATALMYLLALVTLLVLLPGAWRQALRSPGLWLLAVSAGLTNVCFNWAVTVGDVVRVVLLFYLMPAWSVLLAWRVLGEVPTPMALLRLVLAFAGVVLVVLPPGVPLSQLAQGLSAVDLLAVTGGFTFALTNVMLRRLHQVPEQARMLAMFGGGALMAALVAVTGMAVGIVTPVPPVATGWVLLALGLATAFLLGNYALVGGACIMLAALLAVVPARRRLT